GRAVEGTHQVQHRGLAGARRTDHGQQLSVLDGHRHATQRGDPARVHSADRVESDQLAGHFGTPTIVPVVMPLPVISTRPSANTPVSTGTIREVPPSTTSTLYPPPGSASSAETGTVSTFARCCAVNITSTGLSSRLPSLL